MPASSRDGALRILLAEDNPVNQKLTTEFLKKLGHEVVVAVDGHAALSALQQTCFDLVLMDVQMPGMDGIETTAEIRRTERVSGKHIPIVALTAHAMKGDQEKCFRAGMDDYLSKPASLTSLRVMLEKWSVRKQDAAAAAARPGPDAPL